MCSDQLDEVPVKDVTPRRTSSSTSNLNPLAKDFNLNPLAKDFTSSQTPAKNFSNSQPTAKDFVLVPPPTQNWTISDNDASPTLPLFPFVFSSTLPSPPYSIENVFVNVDTSVPPPMPKNSFYPTFPPVNGNPTMAPQFEGMVGNWGFYDGAGNVTFN